MTRPGWPPRDWRAIIALVASIAGAGVMTGFAAWLVWILWRGGWPLATAGQRIAALATALLLVLATVAVVLVGLGMAINRRTARVTGPAGFSFEASGGDDGAPPIAATVTTTVETDPEGARRPSRPGDGRDRRRPRDVGAGDDSFEGE